jgi:hypothetical protein
LVERLADEWPRGAWPFVSPVFCSCL